MSFFKKTLSFLFNDKEYDNDLFYTLVGMAREDNEIGKQIISIIKMRHKERVILIDNVITNMRKDKAPDDLIEAFILLKNEQIVAKIFDILKN
ncbi:MAG: hypothetical protein A2086_10175 [Spirochaetes bacterium GWD1_27_9]|nr:MAG: hypothetical protein A2Z98_08070 [Spirochaetes bacterium GWB1_27_13]OHD35795.1 MAG: hypothetical protein A2086_10175 [Spirochaetes bacterium GWD1_27_9]